MAENKWTIPQQHCISSRGGSVLVSAAAGSGKTTVLVERVLRRLTDAAHPIDIDRLLIVTFTKAAAAEMKQRLSARIGDLLAADPENAHLQRQQMLLPAAPISTIDGFCTAFLREHFDKCGISPRFGIAEGVTATMMQQDALEETMEIFYAAGEDGFARLCDLLNNRRDDKGVKAAVLRTYEFIQAQAFPLQWLKTACQLPADFQNLSSTPWGTVIRQYVADQVGLLYEQATVAANSIRHLDEFAPLFVRLQEAVAVLHNTALMIADNQNDWDTCIAALQNAVPPSLTGGKKPDAAYMQPIKDAWSHARETLRKKLLPLMGENAQQSILDIEATAAPLTALQALVAEFIDRYQQKKQARGMLDFSDLEHLTLSLLYDPATDGPTPLATETALQYTEILVDEFQDTNEVQDTIFRMLSHPTNSTFFVGDVKQSIYGFRQAMPEIFMQKRASYFPYDGQRYPAYITLGENFRSKQEVTDTVNFVFDQLMTVPFCGIDYKDGEALIHAATDAPYACPTEVLLMDNTLPSADASTDTLEAQLIGTRIMELMQSGMVNEKGNCRPIQYGDICILLRSRGQHATAFSIELQKMGIPVSVDVGTPFFAATETQTALAWLRAVDNPLRDVALMAAMLSPVGGFTADDCAAIRVCAKQSDDPRMPLYTALLFAENADIDDILVQKIRAFTSNLRLLRRLATTCTAEEWLQKMLDLTGLKFATAAQTDGEQRLSNLQELCHMARLYEQNGFKGLSAFVRYIDRLEEEKPNLSGQPSQGGTNAVTIMTVHGSKGLEFPVVILAHLFGEFNRDAERAPLILHSRYGAALAGYDADNMCAFDTISKNGVMLASRYTALAEELRILYVALTRAKEKLITVFVKRHLPARLRKIATLLPPTDTVDTARMLCASSVGDWLLTAFMRHPDAHLLRGWAEADDVSTLPCDSELVCRQFTADQLLSKTVEDTATSHTADPQQVADLTARLQYRYPFAALQNVPVKYAASTLAHGSIDTDFIAASRPAFLTADGLSAAEKGTALHAFMQFADFNAAEKDVQKEADRLLDEEFLTAAQHAALDIPRIERFFAHPLYARIRNADTVWREYAFTVPMPLSVYDPTLTDTTYNGQSIIIQGIADCVLEEAGELVIIDYKTDRTDDEALLKERYARQLEIYKTALEEIFSKPVKETLLFAFHSGKIIS